MPTKFKTDDLSDDAIRQRAYLLWEADGRPDGRADHYWWLASHPAAVSKPLAKAAVAAVPVTKAKPKVAKPAKTDKPGKAVKPVKKKV